jgi:type I restriction enzyme R subunit
MRRALNNLNDDLVKQFPDYVCRITSEEGTIGRGYLSKFQELETTSPVLVTTSQLLTTGVDIPTCKNIVLARVINSMVEFKQIIGRGTRVRDDYDKYYFNILDYTGSATRLFADPDFDGEQVEIAAYLVSELDPDGKQLRGSKFSEYATENVRTLYPSAADLRKRWAHPTLRSEIITRLEERHRLRSTALFE